MTDSKTNLAAKLDGIKNQLGLPSDVALAHLLQVHQSTVSNWRRHLKMSAKSQKAILDLEKILSDLRQLYPTPEVEAWLARRNPLLRGETPIQALRGGRSEVVHHLIQLEKEGLGV